MATDKKIIKQQFKVRLYKFILRLLKFLSKLPNDPVVIEIKRQCTRSGTSMGANYFEVEAASSKRDCQNFFFHALKSSNETKFWLAILRDSNLIPKELARESETLLKEAKEIANIYTSSILTMKGKK